MVYKFCTLVLLAFVELTKYNCFRDNTKGAWCIVSEHKQNNIIHVDPQVDYTTTLPALFSVAQHSMTMNELKALLFFIGTTQANTPEDELMNYHEYTFFAGEVASRLQENYPKKRPRMIYETFKALQSKTIEFTDASQDEDEANRKSFALFSTVEYRGRQKNQPLILSLPATLNEFLYKSKERIPFSFDELNQLESANSIRVFMYLKTLSSQGISSISLEIFKQALGFNAKSYQSFKELNRRILRPAEAEIRKATPYKDFSISNNGTTGKSPTFIYWQFVLTSLTDSNEKRATLKLLADDEVARIKELPRTKQDAIMRALQAGYNPHYIGRLIDYEQLDYVFAANVDLAINQSKKNNLSPEDTGKMIWTAVTKNWASQNTNKDYLKRKQNVHRARMTQLELDLNIEQDVAVEVDLKHRASEYFRILTPQDKLDFYQEYKSYFQNVFGDKKVFSLDKYLHLKENGQPDWRYNEIKAARDVIVGLLKNGSLKA